MPAPLTSAARSNPHSPIIVRRKVKTASITVVPAGLPESDIKIRRNKCKLISKELLNFAVVHGAAAVCSALSIRSVFSLDSGIEARKYEFNTSVILTLIIVLGPIKNLTGPLKEIKENKLMKTAALAAATASTIGLTSGVCILVPISLFEIGAIRQLEPMMLAMMWSASLSGYLTNHLLRVARRVGIALQIL